MKAEYEVQANRKFAADTLLMVNLLSTTCKRHLSQTTCSTHLQVVLTHIRYCSYRYHNTTPWLQLTQTAHLIVQCVCVCV